MTGTGKSVKGAWMARLRLLIVLILASLTMSSTIHARELSGSTDIECSGVVHSQDDKDQSGGKTDKALHHGCHSIGATLATKVTPVELVVFAPVRLTFVNVTAPVGSVTGPALRPPIA